MNKPQGRLLLVGAGPGDPELITLKAIKALQKADVILYDALSNEEILDYCRPAAMKKFVGKRFGCHSLSQEEINTIVNESTRKFLIKELCEISVINKSHFELPGQQVSYSAVLKPSTS
jgi:siroheme synthase